MLCDHNRQAVTELVRDGRGIMSSHVESPSSSPSPSRSFSEDNREDNDSISTKNEDENSLDPDQYEERFRVDRRKLEQMLHGRCNGPSNEAEDFFLEVMESTNTQITWPSKLKIGAKSKKDPHIKVSGDPQNVKKAKEKIMAVLDTKSSRVTLKMDVSHTEHSHVIGKGGSSIKKVMEETGCHIHFPDSNRNNQTDKSNQVSIAGQPYGVESARLKIRELLPISLSFEVPVSSLLQAQLDLNSPIIQRIQQTYGVTISFKQRPRALTSTVIVKGTVINSKTLKEATLLLMEHLTNVGTLLPVSLQVEVAAQHHLFMIGRGGSNLQQIMAKTGATICFPDLTSLMSSSKGTIYISGAIDNVLAARECIIGCLPLVLMFDMKEDISHDQSFVNSLMENLDLFISIKPKPKQPSKSVIVKSIEDNVSNMYEARRRLLGLEKEEMPVNTKHSNLSSNMQNLQGLLTHQNLLNVTTGQTKSVIYINNQVSPLTSPRPSPLSGQMSPTWLTTHGIINPALMMIPSTVISTSQQQQVHKLNASPLLQAITSTVASSPSVSNAAATINAIHKDLNENSSLAYNANLLHQMSQHNKQQQTINTTLSNGQGHISPDMNSYLAKTSSAPNSPHHKVNNGKPMLSPSGNYPTSAINRNTSSPIMTSSGSVISTTHSVAAAAAAAVSAAQRQQQQQQQVDLDLLTKTLKHDLNLSSSSGHLMKFQNSGSSSGLKGLHQRAQQTNNSRRSFSLSMSLNGSQHSGTNPTADMSLPADMGFDKKAPGIERLADRLLTQDRLNASAHDRLMSSHNDRLMASGTLMKPPPGLCQPYDGAVNPANIGAALADYERKKVMASKAIEQEPSGETRNPTDFWSGLGFSRSMPDSVIRDRLRQNNVRYDGSNMATTYEQHESDEDGDPWKNSKLQNGSPGSNTLPDHLIEKIEQYGLSTSLGRSNNITEPEPSPQVNPLTGSVAWSTDTNSNTADNNEMADLFHKLGLDKYIELFQQQEIDLATFATLSDQDLKELGITTFGARRKMLLAISDLQKTRPKFFCPTPGSNNPYRASSTFGDGSSPIHRSSAVISQSGRW